MPIDDPTIKQQTLILGNTTMEYYTIDEKDLPDRIIPTMFSKDLMKALFVTAIRIDIPDNNVKASIIKELLGPSFAELGAGTNRISFLHNGLVVKVALDRRGFVDNYTEFKRGADLPQFLAQTYETNLLLNIAEYVEVLDREEFLVNESQIKKLLKELSKRYIFNDVGFDPKNYTNWGSRAVDENYGDEDARELCILDYGYMYPLRGQPQDLFICPKCGGKLKWNNNYTLFRCDNPQCRLEFSVVELWRKMDTTLDKAEDKLLMGLEDLDAVNFDRLEDALRSIDIPTV